MTYSETRENYTFFYSRAAERKEERNTKMLNAVKLLLTWLLPWSVTSLSIMSVYSLFNAKGALIASVILYLSFLFSRNSLKKERMYRIFSVVFSFLVAAASLFTVLL